MEFSLIVPLFLMFLLGLLEFGLVFDHVLTISYASREGARTGAALANGARMADDSLGTCSDVDSYIVAAVERVLDSPGSPIHGDLADVTQIRIYKATSTGGEVGPVNVWKPGSGPNVDGLDLNFERTSYGWDSCTRINNTSNPDSLGVSISYRYHAVTPLASLMSFFGGPGWTTLPVTDQIRHGAQPHQLRRFAMLRRTGDRTIPTRGADAKPRARSQREHGQILVIFAGAMIALMALCAVVVDVAWYWTSNLHMQRAADAAALAGVVWLPGNQASASTAARAEAAKNGYTNGVDGVVVTPSYDPKNPRRIQVKITGPVGTLFARAVGLNSWPAARTAKADYVAARPDGQSAELLRRRLLRRPGLAHLDRLRVHAMRDGDVGRHVHREPSRRPPRRAASGPRPAARSRRR